MSRFKLKDMSISDSVQKKMYLWTGQYSLGVGTGAKSDRTPTFFYQNNH